MSPGLSASYIASFGDPAMPVAIDVQGGTLRVWASGLDRSERVETLQRSPGSSGAVRIRFVDGARIEIADRVAFDRLLDRAGARIPMSQWDASPRPILLPVAAVILFVVGVVFLAYRYAIPVASEAIAEQLPASLGVAMSDQTLSVLDRQVLTPTTLTAERQRQIASAFEQLHAAEDRVRYRLLFRQSKAIGPNALALPSGTIVLTDELVALARDDREILGVLAHEAGHVDRRHGLRLLVQNSLLSAVLAWAVGDVNGIVAAAPTQLLQAKYSRDFERDADAHAAELLRRRGIRASYLADILQRMEQAAGSGAGPPEARKAPVMYDYAASHPATSERLDYLRNLP